MLAWTIAIEELVETMLEESCESVESDEEI